MKDKILKYIIQEYGEYPKENRIKHYSYADSRRRIVLADTCGK